VVQVDSSIHHGDSDAVAFESRDNSDALNSRWDCLRDCAATARGRFPNRRHGAIGHHAAHTRIGSKRGKPSWRHDSGKAVYGALVNEIRGNSVGGCDSSRVHTGLQLYNVTVRYCPGRYSSIGRLWSE
jgi:hypothetical protein